MARTKARLRAYRAPLRLHPAQFREEYEGEILPAYRNERGREIGPFGPWAYFARAAGGVAWNAPMEHLEMLMYDLRYSLRALRRSPWFTAAAMATVAPGRRTSRGWWWAGRWEWRRAGWPSDR